MIMANQDDALSIQSILKSITRKGFRDIWEAAQAGNADKLKGEEQKIARIMIQHQDKYHPFEFVDVMPEHDFAPGNEDDPFTHILVHLAVENQMEWRDPIEVYQFYRSMRRRKCDHHQAVHFVHIVFMHSLLDAMKCQTFFDYDGYRNTLKRLKDETTDNIMAYVEKRYYFFTRH